MKEGDYKFILNTTGQSPSYTQGAEDVYKRQAIDSNRVDSLLLKLDQSIKKRPIYMEQKELRLAKLRRQLLPCLSARLTCTHGN